MSSSKISLIGSLPEELLVQILHYLDAAPPSETKIREEPSLQLTISDNQTLKEVSLLSKRWRRLTLPLLFQHACLRLDTSPRRQWADCRVCNSGTVRGPIGSVKLSTELSNVDQYHVEMAEECTAAHDSFDHQSLRWLSRFYHSLNDFLRFIKRNALDTDIQSFVLSTDSMCSVTPESVTADLESDWCYRAAAAFWQHLLSVLDLSRVVIVAPPTDMARLTNCAINTFDEWAFSDMSFHILDLRLDSGHSRSSSPLLGQAVDYKQLNSSVRRFPGIAPSSILKLRPWHHLTVNEGCFLKAYGTYEYFERGPPSLIYSILDCFTPRPTYGADMRRISDAPLAGLRKLSYIAIFPFATHLQLRDLLPQLQELDLQLAPSLGSKILDDPARIGKADMQDCWSELVSIYQSLTAQLATFRISERNVPRLEKVVCRDVGWPGLQQDLDEVFIPLCLPVWAECEPGVFTRLQGSADGHSGMKAEW
ncbi:hypothetical protein BAUCODRAFT_31584 [Baudoinia panamericana UAMH 10762]|uniref:Uncharacterized protein n=1 Tax=Baudoinia panamericana (strain UAMH 10762) TaxID=717646 RepID=M2LX32_BAUPA|nr:uncharacterized protein BAUCODRAFT_31584 [Baudoinia panamericana UAMH 10762]EMC99247.1 hypothetical protein BAUCODRAFT_31584 [Baudoinia panamericana UAMH 10762]